MVFLRLYAIIANKNQTDNILVSFENLFCKKIKKILRFT